MQERPAPARRETPSSPGRPMNRVGWVFFLGMTICTGFIGLSSALLEPLLPETRLGTWLPWLLQFFVMYVLFLPLCAVLLPDRAVTEPPPRRKLGGRRTLTLFIISLGMLYTVSMVTQILVSALSSLRGSPIEDPVQSLFELRGLVPKLIFGCALAPVGEELLFRGFLLRALRDYGDGFCVFASGLMFGLFHTNVYQFFYAFALGAMFAYITRESGTLFYAISFHVLINLLGIVVIPALFDRGGQQGALIANLFVLGSVLGGFLLFAVSVPSVRFRSGPLPLSAPRKAGLFFSRPGVIAYVLLCLALTVYMALG